MANRPPGGYLDMMMYKCRAWQDKQDLAQAIMQFARINGLEAVERAPDGNADSNWYSPIRNELLASVIDSRWKQSEIMFQKFEPEGFPRGRVYLVFRLPALAQNPLPSPLPNERVLMVMASEYPDGFNAISSTVTLGPRIGQDDGVMDEYGDMIARIYVDGTQKLIEELDPSYLWISETGSTAKGPMRSDISIGKISNLYWANYYNRDYISASFREALYSSPIGETIEMPNGLWFKLHKHFIVDVNERSIIEKQVLQHFGEEGIKCIQWRLSR